MTPTKTSVRGAYLSHKVSLMAYRSESGELFRFDASNCKYPGCSRLRYCEPTGYIHEFCGRTHATAYSQLMSASKPLDFKFKKQSKKSSQGHGKPLVANHKLDHVNHTSKTTSDTSLSSFKSASSTDIKFYHRFEPYYEFTNFAQYPIQLDGKLWPTTEHYFQAQKFIGTPYEEAIRRQPNARGAFDMSRNPSVSHWKRGDWDQVKNDIMLKCLRAKFTQYKTLRKLLLGTGDKRLVEHTSNDSYWGDGGDGSGQNKLGKLLMQVRREVSKGKDVTSLSSTMPYWSSSVYDSLKNDYKDIPVKEKKRSQSGGSSRGHHRRHSCVGSISTTIHSLSPEPEHDVKPVKHKRSCSLSNLTTPLTGSTGIHYQTGNNVLLRGKVKSVENLSHLSQSSKKEGLSPQSAFELTTQSSKRLFQSDRHTKSLSHGDLYKAHLFAQNQTKCKDYRREPTTASLKNYSPKANQSSVDYDIVTHTCRPREFPQ